MNGDRPEQGGPSPEPPPPPSGEEPKPARGGFLPLSLGLGLVFLYLVGLSMLPALGPRGPYGAPLGLAITFWSLFVGYLVLAVALAIWRKTSLTGAGMLIAFGIWLLLGGELCVGVLVQMRQA
ncbi:hypothetical protein [Sinomonas atrocyanea]